MTQPAFAILIITHNSHPHIRSCLQSALRTGAEVLVIDNASSDATLEAVREAGARVIPNPRNLGFAAAVNQGVRATTQPCLLLLNPDAVIAGGIDDLVECCREPRNGGAGGKLLSPEGVPEIGFNVRSFPSPAAICMECLLVNRFWPHNPVNWRYRCLGINLNQSQEVEQPAGAFFMFRRDAWQQLQGFDEGYFPIWFEDVDFCKRLSDHGFHVWFHPNARAYHTGAHSIEGLSVGCRTKYWYRSLLRYSVQQFGFFGKLAVCLSVVTGSLLRVSFGGATYRSWEMLRTYCYVARLAFRSLWISKLEPGVVLR